MALSTRQPTTTPPQGGADQALRRAVIRKRQALRALLLAAVQEVEDELEELGAAPKRRATMPKERATTTN